MTRYSTSVEIACTPAAPAEARELITHTLAGANAADLFPQAQLVVSELVTNAVLHTDCERVRVDVELHSEGRLRLAVVDTDPDHLPVPRSSATAEIGGHGLHIVEGMAAEWGADADGDAKVVWAELRSVQDSTTN